MVRLLAAELAPAPLIYLDAVLPGRALDPAPRRLALIVGHAFDLVEPSHGVADMVGVGQRLLALPGESEIAFVQFLEIVCVHSAHHHAPSSPMKTRERRRS